jgi:hypothetical protein
MTGNNDTDEVRTSQEEAERQRLRRERDRLNRQIARLVADSVRVKDGGDPLERLQHHDELDRHHQEFRAYREALERFHRRYGPLGSE